MVACLQIALNITLAPGLHVTPIHRFPKPPQLNNSHQCEKIWSLQTKTLPTSRCSRSPFFLTRSRRREITTGNFNPLRNTAALLAFDFLYVSIAATSATNAILSWCVPFRPVLVLLSSCLFVCCGQFKIRFTSHLSGRSICWTMLDCCVSVANITEIMDLINRKQGAGCK